jgi:hypothetical protein
VVPPEISSAALSGSEIKESAVLYSYNDSGAFDVRTQSSSPWIAAKVSRMAPDRIKDDDCKAAFLIDIALRSPDEIPNSSILEGALSIYVNENAELKLPISVQLDVPVQCNKHALFIGRVPANGHSTTSTVFEILDKQVSYCESDFRVSCSQPWLRAQVNCTGVNRFEVWVDCQASATGAFCESATIEMPIKSMPKLRYEIVGMVD